MIRNGLIILAALGVVCCWQGQSLAGATATPTPTVTSTPTPTATATPGGVARDTTAIGRARTLRKIAFNWIADATGDVTATTTKKYTGEIIRAVFKNAADGTNKYDVTISDSDEVDIFAGNAASIDAGLAVITCMDPVSTTKVQTAVVDTTLTLSVSGADARHQASTILYLRR